MQLTDWARTVERWKNLLVVTQGSTRSEPRAFSDLVFLHLKFIKRDLKLGQDIKTRTSTHIPGIHDTIHHLDLLIHCEHAKTLWREKNPVAGPLGQPWVSIGSTVPNSNILPTRLFISCTTLLKGGRFQACHQNVFKTDFKGTITKDTGKVQQPGHTEKAKELA